MPNIFCINQRNEYDLIEYWKIKRTRDIIENDFSYHVSIYLDSENKLDSSEQGSEMEFAFILAHFSAFLSTAFCHWELGSWIHAVYLGEKEDHGGESCLWASPALPCQNQSLFAWGLLFRSKTARVKFDPEMCYLIPVLSAEPGTLPVQWCCWPHLVTPIGSFGLPW